MIKSFKYSAIDREEKLQAILAAALGLFAQYGYKKTTVEDIAAELGMTKSNIYFYVAGKRDLYEKTVGRELIRWQESVVATVQQVDDVLERFQVMVSSAFDYLFSHPDIYQIIIRDPEIFTLSNKADRFLEINQGARQLIRDLLQQGIREGRFHAVDADLTTEMLFSIYIMLLIKASVPSELPTVLRMIETGVSLILNGLCKSGGYTQA